MYGLWGTHLCRVDFAGLSQSVQNATPAEIRIACRTLLEITPVFELEPLR